MPETKFGMKLPLQKWPDVAKGDHAAAEKVLFAFDQFYPRALKTLDTYATVSEAAPSGSVRLAKPYVIASVMPEGVYLDQCAVIMDSTEAQIHQATNFNGFKYRDNIKLLIAAAMNAWVQKDFTHHYRADHQTFNVLDSRPVH